MLHRGPDGVLRLEGVSLAALADRFGTPLYAYGAETLRERLRAFGAAFAWTPHLVCYSVKANPLLGLLRLFAAGGAGFDVVSGGELARVRKAGGELAKTVFAGAGKTRSELRAARRAGLLALHLEHEEEAAAALGLVRRGERPLGVGVRLNPEVDPGTHPYIATGRGEDRFGLPPERALALARTLLGDRRADLRGLAVHIGSQLPSLAPLEAAWRTLGQVYRDLGTPLRYLDIGGGLAIPYGTESVPSLSAYAASVRRTLGSLLAEGKATLLLEPGRWLVGPAGVLVMRVLYRKTTRRGPVLIVDAGMNDFLRPTLYGAHHRVEPVAAPEGPGETVDVVGPLCEAGDFLAREVTLPRLKGGDLLALRDAGAYGSSMASQYTSRPRPAEVLVANGEGRLLRRRGTVRGLWAGEL